MGVAAPSTNVEKFHIVFSIDLAKPFANVPGGLLIAVRHRLREVAQSLSIFPPEDGIWRSLLPNVLLLEIEGWHFQYRVDMKGRRLVVDGAVYRGTQQRP